jgi:hypothetical protein
MLQDVANCQIRAIIPTAPLAVKRKVASKAGAPKPRWELFALFDCGPHFILGSATLPHALSGMRVKTNLHSSTSSAVLTANSARQARPVGFEPTTPSSEDWCSSPLSYGRMPQAALLALPTTLVYYERAFLSITILTHLKI